jgi:hypothetical protein
MQEIRGIDPGEDIGFDLVGCDDLQSYKCFGGRYHTRLQNDMFLRNVCNHPQDHTPPQSSSPQSTV